MKLLMFHAKEFFFKTFKKTLENAEDVGNIEKTVEETTTVFIQSEKEDEERTNKVLTKAVKNIAWLSKKIGANTIVLHPFAHLSNSKSSPEFAKNIIYEIKEMLENKGFTVHTTPFGYFYEFKIHVYGESLAKVFKEI